MNPELRAAIDVAKARVKVDSYFNKAQKSSVQGRTQGLWAGSTLGLLAGGMIGGALALTGFIASPLAAILGVGGICAGMGGAGGMLIGAPAGAISGVLAEKERREKAEKLEQEILSSPDKQRETIEAYRQDPVIEQDNTVRETLATYKDKDKARLKLVDPKTILFAASICAVFSALICTGIFLLGVPTGIGYGIAVTSWTGAAGAGAVLGAATGTLFGFNFPIFFSSLCEKAGDLLSGKMVRGQTNAQPVKSAALQRVEATQHQLASEQMQQVIEQAPEPRELPMPRISQPIAADRVVTPEQQMVV